MKRSRLFAPSAEAASCEPNRSTKYSCAGICEEVSECATGRRSRAEAHNDEEGTEADEYGPDDGHNPVDLVVSGPTIHEEPKTHKGTEKDHHDQVVFRLDGVDPVGPHA